MRRPFLPQPWSNHPKGLVKAQVHSLDNPNKRHRMQFHYSESLQPSAMLLPQAGDTRRFTSIQEFE